MKKQILISLILISSILTMKGQIYTPGGTISGSSNNTNVGIGNPFPIAKLDIVVNSSDGSSGTNGVRINDGQEYATTLSLGVNTSGTYSWISSGQGGIGPKNLSLLPFGGNVGIGLNNPTAKLDVAGSIQSRPVTEGSEACLIVGDNFIHDGTIRRWVINRRNDNYFGQGNKGLVIWADKSNGYYAPILFKDDGNLILSGAQNATNNNVGIGTMTPAYKLDVCGTIRAREVKVDLQGTCVPDFVFKSNYKLMDLKELEKFVKNNQHLPGIAPEKEMVENGVNMKELQMKLLQKIEELTLYTIEQNKKIVELEKQNKAIEELKQAMKLQREEIEKLKAASK